MNTPLFSDKVAEIFVKVDDFCNEFENEFKNTFYQLPMVLKHATEKLL